MLLRASLTAALGLVLFGTYCAPVDPTSEGQLAEDRFEVTDTLRLACVGFAPEDIAIRTLIIVVEEVRLNGVDQASLLGNILLDCQEEPNPSACGTCYTHIIDRVYGANLDETPALPSPMPAPPVVDPENSFQLIFENRTRFSNQVFRYLVDGYPFWPIDVVEEVQRLNPQQPREEIVEALEEFLGEEPGVGLENLHLPVRARAMVEVTRLDGTTVMVDLVEGLRLARTEPADFPPTHGAEDSGNTRSVMNVACDINSVRVARMDVFLPVVVRITRNVFNRDGFIIGEECFSEVAPRFNELKFDQEFDPSQDSFTVLRNIDPRTFPRPMSPPECGGTLVIELEGQLTLPFRDAPCPPSINPPDDGRVPSYLNVDLVSKNMIPGRYSINVQESDSGSVQ